MMKRKQGNRIPKKHSQLPVSNELANKLRLQLFFIDELVQFATETFRELEGLPLRSEYKDY